MNCRYYTERILGWMLNNKLIVFLSLLSFCLFVSTLALSGQKGRLTDELNEARAALTSTTTTLAPAPEENPDNGGETPEETPGSSGETTDDTPDNGGGTTVEIPDNGGSTTEKTPDNGGETEEENKETDGGTNQETPVQPSSIVKTEVVEESQSNN
ncbi:hypothetical protein MSG28_012172 [Choristoneura fumiferana]|uniref:Uncharacterized protein n=1 Tax=Choristoneura fumiferana TaxID=7141 RepID=A0ACC0KBY0_CHOFU|nr:hypothetical protein MSG28_012172 [Choristoneura fumiferana]